jgi:SAM-dependent methyltransferase
MLEAGSVVPRRASSHVERAHEERAFTSAAPYCALATRSNVRQPRDVDRSSPPVREQRFVFDEVAELYARVRPSYPRELIDDLIRASALRPGSRVLELGAGPGNASVLFAARGYQLLCLEPGARLAQVARRRLAHDGDAQVVEATFEDWLINGDAFDLVFAAQAFHWIDPAVRFAKAARVLARRGTLAVFSNRPLHGTSAAQLQIQDAYAEHAPELRAHGIGATRGDLVELFRAAPEFEPARWREYGWRRDYSAREYTDLMRTQSDHRMLPEEKLERLLDAIHAVIDANGGRIEIEYVAVSCWARRAEP